VSAGRGAAASSWKQSRTRSTNATRKLLEWSGGDFDPQQFDIDEINRRLASLARHKTSSGKITTAPPAVPACGSHRTHILSCADHLRARAYKPKKQLTMRRRFMTTVRPIRLEDAGELFAVEQAIISAGVGVVQDLADIGDASEYRQRIADFISSAQNSDFWSVAIRDNKIAGYVRIKPYRPRRLRHVGILSTGVAPAHQNAGIGTCIVGAALNWLAQTSGHGLVRIELGVAANNHRAQHIYTKFGFRTEGVRKRFIRDPDGSEIDDHLMVLFTDNQVKSEPRVQCSEFCANDEINDLIYESKIHKAPQVPSGRPMPWPSKNSITMSFGPMVF
jgi:RimJ/RimL family protein N-acetyltransferase